MKIIGWTPGYWHTPEMARSKALEYQHWKERMKAFKPFDLFIACGSWSDPCDCPVEGVTVVNSGLPFTKPYEGHKHHYGIAAFTAAMAYACNRNDWDYLVVFDSDSLIGAANLPDVFSRFSESPAVLMAPAYCGFIGGPFMAWKRDGALRLLHNRKLSNLRDDDEPGREMIWEHECWEIYRGGRWFNPWPNIEFMLEFTARQDPQRPIREDWPFLGQPADGSPGPYSEQCSPRLIPL